ncbi:MAG TPA: PAS domain S-box protein [Leptolyngbyaceae cyanobacterium]
MNADFFTKQLETLRLRLNKMYESANSEQKQPVDLLAGAFKELGTASEELQVLLESLLEQTDQLYVVKTELESERQRYQELFDTAPDAYLLTDLEGKIQEANSAASALLNLSQKFLIGKVLVAFIPDEDRWAFRSKLNQLKDRGRVQEWESRLQPRGGETFDAALRIVPVNPEGKVTALRWVLRDISQEKRALKAIATADCDPMGDRSTHIYTRGEIIPLNYQAIWLVTNGVVKLSTITENAQEILVGLASPETIFGSSLTSLNTYQATALSKEVQLVSISLLEINASPRLAQILFPKISQRLKQAESLLAVTGQKRVKDRLLLLLFLLKQELGQPFRDGIRLSVRLTHEDFANACSTTRVTITRLLSELQQKGQISFDCKSHLILKNIDGDFLEQIGA